MPDSGLRHLSRRLSDIEISSSHGFSAIRSYSSSSLVHPSIEIVDDLIDHKAANTDARSNRSPSRTISVEPNSLLPSSLIAATSLSSTYPAHKIHHPKRNPSEEVCFSTRKRQRQTVQHLTGFSQPNSQNIISPVHYRSSNDQEVNLENNHFESFSTGCVGTFQDPSDLTNQNLNVICKEHGDSEEEIEEIEEAEVIGDDDDGLVSELPTFLHPCDDFEIIHVISRKNCVENSSTTEIDQIKQYGYNCSPSKCVELKDGGFMRIQKIIENRDSSKWIIGQFFLRHNDLEGAKWPRRHNELIWNVNVKEGQSADWVRRPLEQVLRNRHLILTNRPFPEMSSEDHPDACQDTSINKQLGPLFCRWKQTHYHGTKAKLKAVAIESLRFAEADKNARTRESYVRLRWRNVVTAPGGDHAYLKISVTANGHHAESDRMYTFGDMFCGCGGASCGANLAGLYVKIGVDNNKWAMTTYKRNFLSKGTQCLLTDIHDFILSRVPCEQVIDILHISPPCQPYSAANTTPNQDLNAQNQAALFSVGELIARLKPRVVTVEQTYGILNRHKAWFDALVKMFLDASYSIRWTGAKLEEYGLPQKRHRLLIIAAGPGEALPPFPDITHSDTDHNLRPLATIHDAISSIPNNSTITHHNIQAALYRNPESWRQPYSPITQAKTITCGGGIGNHHPSGERMFTMRELAALQNFPMTYQFPDIGVTHLRRQIGNAVPPFIFKKIFRSVIESLKKTDGLL